MSDKPHGPVGERFMRHHYGPSGYVKNGEGPEELGPQPAPGFHFDDRGVLVPDAAPPQPEAGLAALRAERDRLAQALRIIAGLEQCIDNTLGNVEIARRALGEE